MSYINSTIDVGQLQNEAVQLGKAMDDVEILNSRLSQVGERRADRNMVGTGQ